MSYEHRAESKEQGVKPYAPCPMPHAIIVSVLTY